MKRASKTACACRIGRSLTIAVPIVLSMAATPNSLRGQVCQVELAGISPTGMQPDWAYSPNVSPDGRIVSLGTETALLPQDTNIYNDLYVVDTTSGTLEMLSVSSGGVPGNNHTVRWADFSTTGRFAVFLSGADNLAPGLTPGSYVYVRDREFGTTQVASFFSNGVAAGGNWGYVAISGDGACVVFTSRVPGLVAGDQNPVMVDDVYLRDLQTGSNELISVSLTGGAGNASSGVLDQIDISADGRYVVFGSAATDLVVGDTNGYWDVYRRDRWTGLTERVSVGVGGQQPNADCGWTQCSEDGRWVAFNSAASNLVPNDTNARFDQFVRDMLTGVTERVSVDSYGVQQYDDSGGGGISPDGRFVVFGSASPFLVPMDTNGFWDVFLFDRLTRRTERLSVTNTGAESDHHSSQPRVSRNAGTITFPSKGMLVPQDLNGDWDAYIRRCPLPATYCTAKVNSQGCTPAITTHGVPLASWPQGYYVGARQVLNQKPGMLLYSTSGALAAPFAGGILCLQAPIRRTPPQSSGGSTVGSDCTGVFVFDFNAWIASGADPALVAGVSVWTQYWSRDPGFPAPANASLTDAATFVVWP